MGGKTVGMGKTSVQMSYVARYKGKKDKMQQKNKVRNV